MNDNMYLYVISPLVAAVIGGIGFLAKRYIASRDKKHEEEMAERNRIRTDIETRLCEAERKVGKAEKKIDMITALVVGCEHKDCPTRSALSEYMKSGNF